VRSLQIVGRKKSGKTGLVVRLIPLLQEQGIRVGSVKHSSHPHPLDREGSDSWRHREAGSDATLAITAAAASFHFSLPEGAAEIEGLVERYLGSLDLVLIEGWAERRGAKIELLPPDKEGNPRASRFPETDDLIAVVLSPGYRPSAELLAGHGLALAGGAGIPCFYWNDVRLVAEFVLGWWKRESRR
jgi:molybdopterin-guanine dinucleotide biosynthesis protein MobB